MGTLYVTQENAFIGKVDERIHVKVEKQKIADVPLIKVDGVVAFGAVNFSPDLAEELLNRRIPFSLVTSTGRYRGTLEPELRKNIFLRQHQWAADGNTPQAIHLVQAFVRGKLKNYRTTLQRRGRRAGIDLSEEIEQLKRIIGAIATTDSINSLRGLEGAGSAAYFRCFQQLIQNPDFTFTTRNRRPPTDPVNSLLSLGYALLRHDIQSAVNIVGFDPYLGYLHVKHYGRPALALDLMEEFRPLVVDSMVLEALNREVLSPSDFTQQPISKETALTREALKTFLSLYKDKKQASFKHPVMKTKCTYQEAFEIQARLLGKYLMGETEQYPPLVLQ
ncbi:MAG: type I-D CRISPR-associated endonuclease Cas1 [Roseofilum sp. SBFL]|uniref:type I-D CRISPR-associated endonuclease Cas1d n=1 Tax=unclassified Roseofilum TaxID=2620099 RepID=UPI001B026616|nr:MULTISPECIES: type I-D CRISPR-associated endonuclease Cas1d [unclassified Roseofilum]MBP0013798.1 type I-D CRISPR-associated endonuclease Cas1 [Roseofilum sp. SID3]MBP0026250.1 type I-D CRISPR-associated endonuclease Cas1 [Roseofilum sp. SID2]MBP0040576.1 type I-D CRISPR-associated endonuclease Cas1 [Roseofilum sp. SBFL]